MEKKIIVYPNVLLNEVSGNVVDFNSELHTLLDDMRDTLSPLEGIGLAAVQVGVLLNIVLIQDGENFIEVINPVVTNSIGSKVAYEGCFSLPKVGHSVKRAFQITVDYQDRDGKKITNTYEDLMAKVFQHEIDHLNGVLYTERLSKTWKKKILAKYKKLKKS